MPRRPADPTPKPPDFPPAKTHSALMQQLAELEKLRGRRYDEAENDERQWKNLTLNILNHGFGEQRENVSQFHHAAWAGEHYSGGMDPALLQSNFQKRIDAFSALLKSFIAELKLMMSDQEIEGAYEAGDGYQFYRDLKAIVGLATRELFIVDAHLDTQLFDVYVEGIALSVRTRVLTNRVGDGLRMVAEKFARRGKLGLRSGGDVHGRVVFADDRCWAICFRKSRSF